ncbi:uncharacterized protein LOC114480105 isoform X2 [Gouania willdenowi]|uniref:uncharacterized protein LOC114480105 isoform X2 n=1 Tax=Gouania willdenowi TaxID=441366 RepID=UPI001055AF9A|nr:uncharacterized protein LOC114480105 isoform X2 [Gouania willdenowi]
MSHFYNPYSTDQQSSTQTGNGHSSAQVQSDRQKTSHSNYGSGYRSAPFGLSPNIPSLFALPLPAFMAGQSRPAKEEELKRPADLHSDRAREESLHPPRSYAINPLSQGHRKAVAECSDRPLNWLPTYKSTNEDNASKYYTPAASSIFPGGGESRTSAASSIFSGGCESRFTTNVERKPHEQSISGLGEYEFPVREIASAQPKLSQCKYTSELASNILLHFGLEKEDLEQLISYPEDQITPQNLPFILRQIRQQKTTNPVSAVQTVPYPESKTTTSVSDTDFRGHMKEASHQDYRPRGILKTSKVIDYGHVSQLSAGPGEEVGMASEAHSDGSSTLLMDSSGREAKEMSISLLISPRDQESSVPGLVSPFSFKITSKSLPTKNPPKEFSPPPKQFLQMVKVPFTKPKTDTDSRILPGVSKSLSLKDPEPSQLKSSKPRLSDTPSPSVASGRLGVVLYDSLKDPLKQVSKVPEPKQQQPPVQQKEKKQQPATQRSPTSQVDTSRSVPTPNQMYDYAAITPGMYPHSCSLCDKECFSVKEWINHQNTELHLENCKLLRTRFPEWDGQLLTSLSASDVYARSSTARPLQSRKKSQNSSSRSRSRSYSPRRYRGSGSRRDQERSRYRSRSRSYSPRQSSRRTRRSRTRSRSQSPLYRSTTSRYRSRSRSYERRSSPRRRDDRLSSAKRSRSRERRSSEKSSAEKMSKEGKVVEMTDGKQKTGLTMGEMMEENLLLKRITCVEMKRVFSPEFASSNRRVLHITNLPKYEEGSYTERDVANLLTPFGFQHEDEHLHNIYVIPQKRMAFAVLPTAEMVINIIRASVKDCFKLSGCKLFVKILENKISCPMEFYQSLMMWMNKTTKFNHAKKIIFIKNISPSEARNLREVLKKIGNVMNYVPLLNKAFIEFYWMHEADRLGVWYSLLRQPPQHFIYRLGTPRNNVTAQRPDKAKRALPDLNLRVTDANVPTISFIPLGYSPPFYVTMTTFPFIFPTICPWFNIPSFQDPSALKLLAHYSTIMMTGLPEDGYCQLHVARMVWSLFHQRNIHSLFYRVMVLPLQRRAFIYFNTHESVSEFSQRHMTKPFCIKNKPVNIHFVNADMNPGFTEETMYRQLMKLSNSHVPTLSGLDQRLLLVQVSEVSLKLIQAVMKEVASVGRLAGFLPLGNRICIEMLEPSDRMKVMEAKLGSLTAPHIWKKVIRVDTVQSLHQHQLQSLDVTIDLEEDLHWAGPDQTTQDSNTSPSSSTKPAAANTPTNSGSAHETSKKVEMVERGSLGAANADSDVANSDMERPEGPASSEKCTEGQKLSTETLEGPAPSAECLQGVKASVEHPEGLPAGLKPSKECLEGQTPSEKCFEVPTPSEEQLEGPKPTEKHPEGSTLLKECSEGLASSKEWCEGLTSSEKHLEGSTQSKVHLEGMIPSEKCPEGAAPSEEQLKGLTPSEELPQGPMPTEKLPEGPTLSVGKSECLTRSEEGPTTSKQPKTEIEEFPPMGEDTINAILTAIQQHKQAKRGKVPMGFTADVRFSDRGDLHFDQDTDKFFTLDEVSNDTKDTAKNTQSSNKSDRTTERSRSPLSFQRRMRDSCTTAARDKSGSPERKFHCGRDKSRSPERRSHRGRNKSRSPERRSHHSRNKSWNSEGKSYWDMDNSPTTERRFHRGKDKSQSPERRSHPGKDKSPSNKCKEKSSSTSCNSQPGKGGSSGTESKKRSLNTESRYEQESSFNRSLAALSAVGLMLSAENTAAEPEKETHVKVPKQEEISVTQSLKSEEKQEAEMGSYQNLDLFEQNMEEDKEYQLHGPEEDQSLNGLSFQVLDSIDDEGTADREESDEPQMDTSFQALDSVTEDQSATDHVTEVAVAENVSNETKVSTIAKRPRRGRGRKRERKPKVLAANKDITGQENFEVIDLVENPTETEDPEPRSHAPKDVTPEAELEPIKEEEVYQVIDSVDEQSAPNAKKKQGHRGRPTRRSARGRTSEGESEEKQDETRTISEVTKPDSITNKEGVNKAPCTVLDSAGSETIQKTEKEWRRSTRGNKKEKIISQTASSKEEPKYQVINSVEDDVAPEEEVMVTRATRERRGWPAKRDIPTRGHTAAKECEEDKETSPKAEKTTSYKVIESVEDEGAPDAPPVSGQKRKGGRRRNIKATSKHAISKKAKVEIEKEPNCQIIDSMEEAADEKEISDDPGTAEKSSTPEDDYNKQKITESVCEEDKEQPTYQIVDSVETGQGEEETEDDPVPGIKIPDFSGCK